MSTNSMNSMSYWDDRFRSGDWDAKEGCEQSLFFSRLAISSFPSFLKNDLQKNEWTVLDIGCAEGDGTAYLAKHFPSCSFIGADFSSEAIKKASSKYPFCEFKVVDVYEEIPQADVVFSSNTLEHLSHSKKVLRDICESSKKYAILLLPYEDDSGIEEHINIFSSDFFPINIGNCRLKYSCIIDCAPLKSPYWYGKQIILVYVNESYCQRDITLDDLWHPIVESHQKAIEAIEDSKRAEIEAIQKNSNASLEALRTQLDQCAAEAEKTQAALDKQRSDFEAEISAQSEEYEHTLQANEEMYNRSLASQKQQQLQWKSRTKQLLDEQKQWLDAMGAGKAYRLAHWIMRIKHEMLGTQEERRNFWQWLRKKECKPSKYNYLYQAQQVWEQLQKEVCCSDLFPAANTAFSNMPLNGYEYKFYRYLKKRDKQFNANFSSFAIKKEIGLVSVVLPVYNGDDMIEQSINSVLNQTYTNFELIVVDDGSQDQTPRIVDELAAQDKRIRVVHQENAKLPRALNNGFSLAHGEFLTWTSADNIMHEDFLEKLVGYMQKNPDLAMCYANIRAIDGHGNPIRSNTWYSNGEQTGNVYLPNATLRLNTYPENTVAAAFMYRREVPALIGGYDPSLYTVEDYDYWMRINDFFNLRHVDFSETIYDYRFHDKSLTSKAKELHINEIRERLMLTEDYREDYLLRPLCWIFYCGHAEAVRNSWSEKILSMGHLELTDESVRKITWPPLATGVVKVTIVNGEMISRPDEKITADEINVLVAYKECEANGLNYDLQIRIDPNMSAERLDGWVYVENEDTAISVIQIVAKSQIFQKMLTENRKESPAEYKATIVICTYKRTHILSNTLHAALRQNDVNGNYEILVINNDPFCAETKRIVDEFNHSLAVEKQIRYIDCPYPGLSAARNFALYGAKGETLLFVDDDGIMDAECLHHILETFESSNQTAIVGGTIKLNHPEAHKDVILPGYESVWSARLYSFASRKFVTDEADFPYGCNYAIKRQVLRDLGGFRISYGRVGKDFSGGEEMVLSHLAIRAGYQIAVEPRAIVIHDVEESRYTLEHVKQTLRSSALTNRLMKMDMYRQFDLSMQTEKAALEAKKEQLQKISKRHINFNDLRKTYLEYEIAALEEAIQEGQKDELVMQSEGQYRETR